MSENHREPEVPEEEVPVVECLDGFAKITSKKLATTRSVKSGTLQNTCSTRPRVFAGLEKSARMHTVRLMNSRLKGPNKMIRGVKQLFWRRMIGMKIYGNVLSTVTKVTRDRGDLTSSVIPVMS